jgi:hypothetical protein
MAICEASLSEEIKSATASPVTNQVSVKKARVNSPDRPYGILCEAITELFVAG